MHILKLPHFAVRSPTNIAVARSSQIEASKLFETTRAVKARGQFVSERLVLDEAVVAGGADRLFIETLRIEFSVLEAGDLGAREYSAAFEVLRAAMRPAVSSTMPEECRASQSGGAHDKKLLSGSSFLSPVHP